MTKLVFQSFCTKKRPNFFSMFLHSKMTHLFFQSLCTKKWPNFFFNLFALKNDPTFFSIFLTLKSDANIFEKFLVTFYGWKILHTHVSTSFFLTQKMKSHLTWSWAVGSQIWFKNWFSNAPIFFSCGPIFTSTVSKIFSLDRRIHFGTSWHPQMCHSYLKQTQQSWKKLKISPNPWFRSTANLLS